MRKRDARDESRDISKNENDNLHADVEREIILY